MMMSPDVVFTGDDREVKLTASLGLCGVNRVPIGTPRFAERMRKIADLALYRSTRDGSNRLTATNLEGNEEPTATDLN